jgi:hypothetical protein
VSVTYSVAQATPYSILISVQSAAGTAPAGTLIDLLSDYATEYGAGYATTPFYLPLANGGVGFPDPGTASSLVYENYDIISMPAFGSSGFNSFLILGSWSGVVAPLNFRLSVTDSKAANGDSGINLVRIALRHSIVR